MSTKTALGGFGDDWRPWVGLLVASGIIPIPRRYRPLVPIGVAVVWWLIHHDD
jgi:hypothetical protein